jgi:hypothetical protein
MTGLSRVPGQNIGHHLNANKAVARAGNPTRAGRDTVTGLTRGCLQMGYVVDGQRPRRLELTTETL